VIRFIPATSSGSVVAVTKSSPRSRKAWTGAETPDFTRLSRSLRSLPVRSGFCSEPDSANSFSTIFFVDTNQVCSWPVCPMWASVPRVSKPGNSGTGRRFPVASSHSEEGPGRIRMPCRAHTGEWLVMPSV
jgi:hypothetical protein